MSTITAVLHNFYLICQWHRRPFEEESNDLEALHRLNVMENEEEEIGAENEKDLSAYAMQDKEGVSVTTLLQVLRQLRVCRRGVWHYSQRMVNDCIDCSKLDSANIHLVKEIVVNDLCMYFMQVGAVTRREH